jgi:PAS domain S-box-containing protein
MSLPSTTPGGEGELRRRAVRQLRKIPARAVRAEGKADEKRLIQELQIHQIELELQNEELKNSKAEVDLALERYTDLYDFAPIGYFSLDQHGLILEVNLTGAALFGMERAALVNRRFQLFVAPERRAGFNAFLGSVFAGPEKQADESLLLNAAHVPFWANLQAMSAVTMGAAPMWCRMSVIDISARKQADQAQRRIEILTVTSQGMEDEIVRRRALETTIRESELRAHQLTKRSHEMQKKLRELTHRIITMQEEERKEISRELHDVVVQTLIGINVNMQALCAGDSIGRPELREKIAQTQRLVKNAVDTVHRFARGLRPSVLDDLGLIPALHGYCKILSAETKIAIFIEAFGGVEALGETEKTVLYRVAQAALSNVARHAHATKVNLTITEIAGAIRMEIGDDGKSFDVEKILLDKNPKRLGLIGMKERLEMVGGSLVIESAPGKGTTVRAEIPFARKKPKE